MNNVIKLSELLNKGLLDFYNRTKSNKRIFTVDKILSSFKFSFFKMDPYSLLGGRDTTHGTNYQGIIRENNVFRFKSSAVVVGHALAQFKAPDVWIIGQCRPLGCQ